MHQRNQDGRERRDREVEEMKSEWEKEHFLEDREVETSEI
jgi:hypothetical protein